MPDVRLLELLTVLQTRTSWSSTELTARLGVTARTLRRDIDRLRQLGYPVRSVPGRGGGYLLGRGGKLPPLMLDDEEAMSVAIGLRTAAGGTVAGLGDASLRALVKLDQVLPRRLRERVNALREATAPLDSGAATVDANDLVTLARVCEAGELTSFDYRDATGHASVREVEPHRLVPTGRRWYLVGYDRDRADWRTFRVDRISHPQSTGQRCARREAPDAADFVSRSVGSAPYAYQAAVMVHAPPERVRALVSPVAGTVSPRDDGGCELRTGADSLETIAIHLAMLGEHFTVLEPAELTDVVGRLADRLHRSATGG